MKVREIEIHGRRVYKSRDFRFCTMCLSISLAVAAIAFVLIIL